MAYVKAPARLRTISGSGSPSRLVNPGGNTTSRAVGLLQQAGGVETLEDLGHQRLVAALAGQVVVGEQHAELVVDLVPVRRALLDECSPQRHRLGVAVLQQHDPLAGPLLELLVGRELGGRVLVEGVEVAQLERAGPLGADVDEVLDEHAERAAPVTDVVLPHDVVADGLEQPHQGVADDRRAEVPDVHLLGDVRRRVVDDDALGMRGAGDAEALVGGHLGELSGRRTTGRA